MIKVIAKPNYCCNFLLNYTVAYYNTEIVCKYAGVKACNGYHSQPNYAVQYAKTPYATGYATATELEQLKSKYDVEVQHT